MNNLFIYLTIYLFIQQIQCEFNCVLNTTSNRIKPHVYYINLKDSIERNNQLVHHLISLDFKYNQIHRINALTIHDFVIPTEIEIPYKCLKINNIKDHLINNLNNYNYSLINRSIDRKIVITSHCGRPRNTKRDLAVTLSHIQAIYEAVMSNDSLPYALIMEDDMKFGFEVDFNELVSSAPSDWGILQLITTNQHDIKQLWSQYLSIDKLWTLRTHHDLWCAGAYIINKRMLYPLVNSIITPLSNGWIGYDIIAGYDKPCTPFFCCNEGKLMINQSLPCFRSARGYQADHFVFGLTDGHSFALHTPLVTGASVGNNSTLHQSHVSIHIESFNKINDRINDMKIGKVKKPDFFINSLC